MTDNLDKLVYAFELVRCNRAVVIQNIVISALVVAVFASGALAWAFSLPVAVVRRELSELLVIANGTRMLPA